MDWVLIFMIGPSTKHWASEVYQFKFQAILKLCNSLHIISHCLLAYRVCINMGESINLLVLDYLSPLPNNQFKDILIVPTPPHTVPNKVFIIFAGYCPVTRDQHSHFLFFKYHRNCQLLLQSVSPETLLIYIEGQPPVHQLL